MNDAARHTGSRSGRIALLPAALWAVALFGAFGFLVPPGPETPRHWFVFVALIGAVGALHAAALGLAARAARRAEGSAGAAADLVVALGFGLIYAFLLLSLAKFVVSHAHLSITDLRFLAPSLAQVGGEATDAERRALRAAALSPLLIAALLFTLLRVLRRSGADGIRSRGVGSAGLGAGVAGALLLGGLALFDPVARWATTTLLPEAAFARLVRSGYRLATSAAPAAPTVSSTPGAPQTAGGAALPAYRPGPLAVTSGVPGAPGAPNVLIVMLESVPWKRAFGPEARPESTPHLVALAREAFVFERAYAVSTHSDYAQTAILASLHPRRFDHHDLFADLSSPRALPWDVLGVPGGVGGAGYRSGHFSTQNEGWGNMRAFLETPALGTLRHAPDFPDAPHRGEGLETKLFEATAIDAFLAWVDRGLDAAPAPSQSPPPFVASLNFQATHFPYVWPETFAPPYGAAPLDFDATFLSYSRDRIPAMLDRFHNALASVDAELGRLLAELERRGLLASTAIALVADHGEAFYEHGVPTHGTQLFDEQVRVPMLLRLPAALAAASGGPRTIAAPVSTLDLLPTLYRALGLPRHGALQGRDDLLERGYDGTGRELLLTIQGMTREDALVSGGWKWILNRDTAQTALFELASDPGERHDRQQARQAEDAARAQALAARLDQLVAEQLAYYRAREWERGSWPPRLR